MEYIKLPITKILSSLTLNQIKPFKKAIMEKKFKSYLNNVFKDKDRLYLDFKTKNVVNKPPIKLSNFLEKTGYYVVDYNKGLAKNNKSDKANLIKIGKLLNKNKELKLLKEFNEDKSRTAGKKSDLLIVVSRHPYDIAGMSTGRGWTSCMNLDKNEMKHYITRDIENGTLVAYIINIKDKNINKPISRLLIKPYINIEDEKDIFLYPEKKVYGTNINGFRTRIIKWLKTFQKLKGVYKFNKKLYDDNSDPFIAAADKESSNYLSRIAYYEKNPKDKDAKKDEDREVRKFYYRNNLNDKDSKNDKDKGLRMMYYYDNPNDKDAKKNEDINIRYAYYEKNPIDGDAKTDEDGDIRELYYKNNPIDGDAKTDKSPSIRKLYYKNHPIDKDAKTDKFKFIRKLYYRNNPDDEDAKKDKDSGIRRLYYKNNLNDKDYKKDRVLDDMFD